MFNYTQVDEAKIEYVKMPRPADLPNGERMFVEIEGKPIVIFESAQAMLFDCRWYIHTMKGRWAKATLKATTSLVRGTAHSSMFVLAR